VRAGEVGREQRLGDPPKAARIAGPEQVGVDPDRPVSSA
jgi:hypothetical protein